MNPIQVAGSVGAALLMCATSPSMAGAQAQAQTPRPTTQTPASSQRAMPSEAPRAQTPQPRRSGVLQGFSVVLVVGDLQGTSATDDVPIAARKALTDMREFLPYKSYRLLDAGWLMCCGADRPGPGDRRLMSDPSNLALRGADEQEYEVKLYTSRPESGRVMLRFVLFRSGSPAEAASSTVASARTLQRRLADLEDRAQLQQKQIAEARRRAEVGVAPATEIPKMEVELRTMQREIEDLKERIATGGAGRSNETRAAGARMTTSAVIDTSFTMDVGETVVVGASRPRGATKALIALVTAVPRGGAGGTKD